MNIRVIAVGKIREKYISAGLDEYLRRLRPLAGIEILEVPAGKVSDSLGPAGEEQVKKREGERILRLLKDSQVVVALAAGGRLLSSPELAGLTAGWVLAGRSELAFVIGGSLGLPGFILDRAELVLSFGRLTFPHQLMRLILLEQIYRVLKINRGEPYHK